MRLTDATTATGRLLWIDPELVQADAELHGETAAHDDGLAVALKQVRATMRPLASTAAAAARTTPDPILIPEQVVKGLGHVLSRA